MAYFQDPSFHMSIAWCVGDYENAFKSVLPQLNHKLSEFFDNFDDDNWYIYVKSVYCKTGNKYFEFALQ